MLAVTVGAAGRHGIAPCGSLAMEASAVRACLRLVAGAAIDELELLRVPASPAARQVRVAFHARQARVNGRYAGVFGHEYGYLLIPAVAREVRPRVTPEASRIVLGWRGACRQKEDRGDREETALPMTTVEAPVKGRTRARTQDNAKCLLGNTKLQPIREIRQFGKSDATEILLK